MTTSLELALDLDTAAGYDAQRTLAARLLGIAEERITGIHVRKRSIDARGRRVLVRLQADVHYDEPAPDEDIPRAEYRTVTGDRRVVVVGCGPAGMFAALRLIQRQGIVDPDSNYCFGEGGAGTYSDGKLYTRATKRGSVEGALRTLVAHGAQPEILIDAHPHIGSNRLPKVVAAMRESIIAAGGEIRFATRVEDLIIDDGRVRGVVTAAGDEVTGEGVILATGHSARDIFRLLLRRGVLIEAKPFAMGVRIEHPQPLIDSIQYHAGGRDPRLPAASYRLASTVRERGVFSFCMCPGGFIVPSATEQDEVVVNGMSLSRRDSPYANSGMVVAVETEDLEAFGEHGALAGMYYQKSLEVMARQAGGGTQRAPAQRVTDFIANKLSATLPACSYKPGIAPAPLHELLPPALARRLQGGLKNFGASMRGYVTEEAVIVGVETRTSSPVRIPRDAATLEHPMIKGLYPCGEGAGYAGGIISAAIDGVRCAEAVGGGG